MLPSWQWMIRQGLLFWWNAWRTIINFGIRHLPVRDHTQDRSKATTPAMTPNNNADSLAKLPHEILLYIFALLEPKDLAAALATSRTFSEVGRDARLWKANCFNDSPSERARQQGVELYAGQDAALAALRMAMNAPDAPFASVLTRQAGDSQSASSNAEGGEERRPAGDKRWDRALEAWDPSFPEEAVDFYQEYLQRHAPITVSWAETAYSSEGGTTGQECESEGMAVLEEHRVASKIVSPLDDGSVCIWDLCGSVGEQRRSTLGQISARTTRGFLAKPGQGKQKAGSWMCEAIVTDNTSIDSARRKAYFAVQDELVEVDIATLAEVSRTAFPAPITCLSEATSPLPLTIGTNESVHLYDTRVGRPAIESVAGAVRCEQIGGRVSPSQGYAKWSRLTEPGPLSILHLPGSWGQQEMNGEVWVAGRFTSLLVYDRRMWPQIRGTVFSGARLSCLSSLPYPRGGRTRASTCSGATVLAAGQYKGKGSLELYSVRGGGGPTGSAGPVYTLDGPPYYNRQTASKSRLLAAAAHGARLVYSDGDGNVKWVERDGKTAVRTFNINEHRAAADGRPSRAGGSGGASGGASGGGSGSLFARDIEERGENDIVQQILPVSISRSAVGSGSQPDMEADVEADMEADVEPEPDQGVQKLHLNMNLLIKTGDGRVGMLEFGRHRPSFGPFSAHPGPSAGPSGASDRARARARAGQGDDEARTSDGATAGPADADAGAGAGTAAQEREYGRRMREAIERQANDARFLRSLGPAPTGFFYN